MAGDDRVQTDWEALVDPGVVPALAALERTLTQLLAAVQARPAGPTAPGTSSGPSAPAEPPVPAFLQPPSLPNATAHRTRTIAEGTILVGLTTLTASPASAWGAFTAPATGECTLWLTSSAGARLQLTTEHTATTADLLGGQPLPVGQWTPVAFPVERGHRYAFQVATATTLTYLVMFGALGGASGGATALAPLTTHLPIPTFHTVGTTAVDITLTTYTTALPSSVELWNRGSTDLYVNFNGVTATGDTATSTDEHLAPNETWSGNVQVTSLSVISSAAGGLLECQFWGP